MRLYYKTQEMKKDLFNTFKVARLLAKDLAGCLDGEERRMLDDWLAEEASHRKFYAEMRMEAEQSFPWEGMASTGTAPASPKPSPP